MGGGLRSRGWGGGIPSPLGEGAVPSPQKNVAFFASKLHVFDAL